MYKFGTVIPLSCLRLGNYVVFEKSIAKVIGIYKYSILIEQRNGQQIQVNDAQPLAFTEAILLGFGFKEYIYKSNPEGGNHYRLELPLVAGLGSHNIEVSIYPKKAYGEYKIGSQSASEDFYVVHELQNLYFAVMKTELLFKQS